MRPFRGRFFRPHGIAEEGRISGFWGDLAGFAASRGLIPALACRAKQARLSRFRYFEVDGLFSSGERRFNFALYIVTKSESWKH